MRAISVPDAAAFIDWENRLRLLRPPFTLSSSPEVTESDLQIALRHSWYQPIEMTFAGIPQAVEFLRSKHRLWAGKIGLPTEGTLSAEEVLVDASPALAHEIIDRIEQQLLPVGMFATARDLLLAILGRFENDQNLQIRAAKVIAKISSLQPPEEGIQVVQNDRRFRTLDEIEVRKKVTEISNTIRERHCVLAIGC
jgi:hypothetical protein